MGNKVMKDKINKNPFELLRTKEIIAILDGDSEFGTIALNDGAEISVALPYLSGPTLCGISTLFGLPAEYKYGFNCLSRWEYVDNLLEFCIKEGKCSDLLSYLFGKDQFVKKLERCDVKEIDDVHKQIIETVINKINGKLYFSNNELVKIDNTFYIHKIGVKIEVATPKLKTVDRDYIISISSRAMKDVDDGNFDSAITKSRTLLEETFCYVLEKKNITPSTSGDIAELYKQVKTQYNMHTDPTADRRIKTLLSGLNSIVSAIAEMRNKDSDAHGVGSSRIPIKEHHTRLFVNSSMTMADFILSVAKNN